MYAHVNVGVFTSPFIPSRLVDSTFQRMDGAPVDAWPYFPGVKVGKLFISIVPIWVFGGVSFNRYIVVDWNSFHLPFLFIQSGFIKFLIRRTTQGGGGIKAFQRLLLGDFKLIGNQIEFVLNIFKRREANQVPCPWFWKQTREFVFSHAQLDDVNVKEFWKNSKPLTK